MKLFYSLLCALLVSIYSDVLTASTIQSIESLFSNDVGLFNNFINALTCDLVTCIQPSDSPYTISKPGKYSLADDIPNASIIIAANNVDLNLNGHTLSMGASGSAIQVQGCMNVRMYNGLIQGTASPTTATGILLSANCYKIKIDDITILNCANGIVATDSSTIAINECLVQNGQIGIELTASASNCTDFAVNRCSCINNSLAGIQINPSAPLIASSVKLSNCHISNSTANGSTANPTYGIYVNQTNGIDVENCILDTNTYGIYVINSLAAHIRGGKLLNSAYNGLHTCVSSANANLVLGSLIIENLIIDHAQNYGFYCLLGNDFKIRNCSFTNAGQSAVYLSGCTNIHAEKNLFTSVLGATAPIVVIGDSLTPPVSSIKIADCAIENFVGGAGLTGITVTNSTNTSIERCYLAITSEAGIQAQGDVGNLVISDCVITNNPNTGISFINTSTQSNSMIVSKCHILGTNTNGILISNAANCIIRDSEFSCTQTGINLTQAYGIVIFNNIFSNCSTGIALDSLTNSCSIRDNDICSTPCGISDNGGNSTYHNYVSSPATDAYINVPLVVQPKLGIGAHENFQG